ncbi:ABC transporter permease [bacterium]|nr:ABC transporter permease [bacterium]
MLSIITEFSKSILIFAVVLILLTLISVLPVQNSVVEKKVDQFFLGNGNLLIKFGVLIDRIVSGDFGKTPNGNSIFDDTLWSYMLSLELIIIAGAIAVLLSIVLSLYAAKFQNSLIIKFLNIVVFCFCNIPYFLTAIVFIFIFSIMFEQWFGYSLPVTGMRDVKDKAFNLISHIRHLILPVSIITLIMFSQMYSFLRMQAETIYKKHYIKFSYALGLPERLILFKYVLKNLLADILRNTVNLFQTIIGIIIIIEIIFSWPGIGLKAYKSVINLNVATLFCIILMISCTVILLQFIVQVITKSEYGFLRNAE